ncbi:MAG: electron transfer flavoprotein subunit alpha/FixB family protein [Dehalococcoidia bacterium]|nr:electron transfer flavoprotein subunit alpha/FixB family protein [Dehalococcoidia bacterium]
MTSILVLGELTENNSLDSVTGELIAAGRQISDDIGVTLLGTDVDRPAHEAIALGASSVYTVDDEALSSPEIDPKVTAFAEVCNQTSPDVVLVGKTQDGREIGPRVAFRLEAGLAQDCIRVGIDADSGRVVATRPVYGGSAMAAVTFPGDGPQVVVMRGRAYEPSDPDASRTGDVVSIVVDLESSPNRVRNIRTVAQASEGVRLEDADVVVAGGRGLGGPEPFEMVGQLADLLGGAMGASRAACDAGWLDHSYQVGLTGRTIAPNVYITVGISGASQHMAGCSGAKHIVAINKDREANIFKDASYGVVGDWEAVIPSFMETVRDLVDS